MKKVINIMSFMAAVILIASCKELVDIDPPVNSVVTEVTFKDDKSALSTVSGLYRYLFIISKGSESSITLNNGGMTIFCGMSADELSPFSSNNLTDVAFFNNNLISGDQSTNGIKGTFWGPTFFSIYQANACLEGLNASEGISVGIKERLRGEVKFIRAFCFFNLVNLFGDIPYPTTTKWDVNSTLPCISQSEVYRLIIKDLEESISVLPDNYAASNNERIIANKWAAIALMARVQLYLKNWSEAERNSSLLLDNNGLFELNDNLNEVFLKNNAEAILQWQINSADLTLNNATVEAYNMMPLNNSIPVYNLTDGLLAAFEPNDKRKADWVKSLTYLGTSYQYPYKYKIGQSQSSLGATPTEYYMVLRLAEQYLIRAEARAHLNKMAGPNSATSDLSAIRNRAGLNNTTATTQTEMLDAIAHERRIELFAEWGHRWLDLKRTGKVNEVLAPIKPMWKPHQQYYPIPLSELQLNPNLTPTPGY